MVARRPRQCEGGESRNSRRQKESGKDFPAENVLHLDHSLQRYNAKAAHSHFITQAARFASFPAAASELTMIVAAERAAENMDFKTSVKDGSSAEMRTSWPLINRLAPKTDRWCFPDWRITPLPRRCATRKLETGVSGLRTDRTGGACIGLDRPRGQRRPDRPGTDRQALPAGSGPSGFRPVRCGG